MVRLHRQFPLKPNTMKIFTTKGRRVKRTESKYERFITIQIELGMSPKEARNDWKLLNISIQQKAINLFQPLNNQNYES